MYAEELRLEAARLKKENLDSAKIFFAKSVSEFDQAFEILGDEVSVSQYLDAQAEVLLGVGDTARAETVLEESIQKRPNSHFAKFKLAAISYNKGDFEKAKRLYLESLKAEKPDLYATYKNLGLAYLRLNENTNAIAAFEKAIEEQEDPEIDRNLAYLYTEIGDLEKAASYQSEDEEFSVEETAFLYTMRDGNDAFQKNDFSTAVLNYAKIEKDFEEFGGPEKYPSYFAAYAKSLLETGDTLAAKSRFLKANEVDPNNSVVLTNLGTIAFMKDKNYSNAERYFREAILAGPENMFTAYTNLGTVLIMQRKEKEAIEAFEKSLQYGSSKGVLGNLFLLNKALGNEERMNYYQEQLAKSSNQ